MSAVDEKPEPKLRLGGMALRNGLLVHGPTHWAAAVRNRQGEIEVASGVKPRIQGVDNVPGVRGIARLTEAFAVIPLVLRGLPAARLPFQDVAVVGVAGATAVAGNALRRRIGGTGGEAIAGVISMAPALFTLTRGDVASYHGVEHKAIAAYEQDEADAGDASKEHDRCGSNLVAPMMAANIAGNALLRKVVAKPGNVGNAMVSLGSMAAAVEIFAWSERHAETRLSRALRRPGYELQRTLGTREPDDTQLEVGRAALTEILRVERKKAAAA